jgi:hypothetical protein
MWSIPFYLHNLFNRTDILLVPNLNYKHYVRGKQKFMVERRRNALASA